MPAASSTAIVATTFSAVSTGKTVATVPICGSQRSVTPWALPSAAATSWLCISPAAVASAVATSVARSMPARGLRAL
eukprot:6787819-Pyramimonas_sp.AAC.1